MLQVIGFVRVFFSNLFFFRICFFFVRKYSQPRVVIFDKQVVTMDAGTGTDEPEARASESGSGEYEKTDALGELPR